MKNCTCVLLLLATLCSCGKTKKTNAERTGVDKVMIDSIKNASDSSYSKRYAARDFVKAEYYVNLKDSTLVQLMKDSSDTIRQVIITRNKDRKYFAQYYDNGQLMASYHLDAFGQYDGASTEYYRNGVIQGKGTYHSGLRTGKWQTFDEDGKYKGTIVYNKDGQQEQVVMENINN